MIDSLDFASMQQVLPSTSSKYSGKFDWASLLADWQFFVGDYLEVPLHPHCFLDSCNYTSSQAE